MSAFSSVAKKIDPSVRKRVVSIKIRVCVTDCTGEFFITDMQLQGGSLPTGWVGHVSEIQWTLDG